MSRCRIGNGSGVHSGGVGVGSFQVLASEATDEAFELEQAVFRLVVHRLLALTVHVALDQVDQGVVQVFRSEGFDLDLRREVPEVDGDCPFQVELRGEFGSVLHEFLVAQHDGGESHQPLHVGALPGVVLRHRVIEALAVHGIAVFSEVLQGEHSARRGKLHVAVDSPRKTLKGLIERQGNVGFRFFIGHRISLSVEAIPSHTGMEHG